MNKFIYHTFSEYLLYSIQNCWHVKEIFHHKNTKENTGYILHKTLFIENVLCYQYFHLFPNSSLYHLKRWTFKAERKLRIPVTCDFKNYNLREL